MRRDALWVCVMAVEIGSPSDDAELRAAVAISAQSFLSTADESERWLGRLDPADIRVARIGSRVVGMLEILPIGQWFGGRRVPMAGIASVAVLPDVRASGVGRKLMLAALDDVHGRGLPISALYPATQPLYRSVGYEQAGSYTWFRLRTSAIGPRDTSMPVRPLDKQERDLARELYARRAARTAGNVDRNDAMWDSILEGSRSPTYAYLAGDEGYVVFTQHRERHEIRVRDLVATSAASGRRLLTLIADHRSQIDTAAICASPGDPLFLLTAEDRREVVSEMAWMLRVVDVRGASAARGWPPNVDAELHLQIRDEVLPWNDGRFVAKISAGKAEIRKGGRGRVRIDVRALASLYTGRLSAPELQIAGLVEGPAKDLVQLSAVFAGPSPWMADFF